MQKKSSEQLVFPIIVGALSLLSIAQNFQTFYWTSIVVSLIGLAGTALFLLNNKFANNLFYGWIVLQLVTYSTADFTYFTNQLPFLHLGFSIKGATSTFVLNFAPMFFFIGHQLLKMYDLIGKKVSIRPIKADSILEAIEGEITAVVNLGSDGKWLKVDYVEASSNEMQSIIIKPKGDERFSRKKSILAFVKVASSHQFIDWGKVKLM